MIKYLVVFITVFILVGCDLTVQDPLTPAERATVSAERTVAASLLHTVTPTPEPPVHTMEPQVLPEMCIVKGNISGSTGEKIYHVDGQANYSRVIIDPDHGERCFDTEEEAVAAGWRKALR